MNFVSRNSPCPCGSNLKFKNCHGNLSPQIDIKQTPEYNSSVLKLNKNGYYTESLLLEKNREVCKDLPKSIKKNSVSLPHGMVIIENFLDDSICKKLIDQTEFAHSKKATIVKTSTTNFEIVDESNRKTDVYDLGECYSQIKLLLQKTFSELLNKYYSTNIVWYEEPQLLRYVKGGFYHPHSDSESWDSSNKKWYKSMPRDFSFLIYLNEEFTGGEIIFPNFDFKLKPRKGMFVCFPSDHRFIHKVTETLSGVRYAIVTWAASSETETDSRFNVKAEDVIRMPNL
jgi:predicted 2-oxoglutarate/Fe(II)-dependent dioxygenase YbiX